MKDVPPFNMKVCELYILNGVSNLPETISVVGLPVCSGHSRDNTSNVFSESDVMIGFNT
jgi:hypothetical protein